jgi:pimeloyl-ACP methyl ester carboxylesterase
MLSLLGSSSSSSSSSATVAAKAIAKQAATITTTAITTQDSSSSSSFFASHFLSALFGNAMSMSNSLMPSPKQFLLAYLLSPWTMSWLLRGVGPVVQVTLAVATARSEHRRTRALPEAWQVLSLAIQEGRAYRTRKYDAYLPPSLSTTTTTSSSLDSVDSGRQLDPACVASFPALSFAVSNDHTNSQQQQQLQPGESVILFIPGSGLDPTGYAPPAKMLSDCGHVVIVLSSEPLRMASPSLGFTSAYAKRVIRQVNRELNNAKLVHRRLPRTTTTTTTPNGESLGTAQPLEPESPVPPRERTFHLLGHSLGAFTASHWVQDLNTTKLILWAALPVFSEYLNDLSSVNSNNGNNKDNDDDDDALQVLVLQVSNDGIQQVMMETTPPNVLALRTKTFWQRLPQGRARGNVEQRLLMGATHNGFASHEAGYFLTRPEIQDITRLQQQQQAVAMTHEFLVHRRT